MAPAPEQSPLDTMFAQERVRSIAEGIVARFRHAIAP